MEMQTRRERDLECQDRQNKIALKMIILQIVRQINPEWADKLEKAEKILGYIILAIVVIGFIVVFSLR